MLRTRLWMGAVLIAVAVAMLVFDQYLEPWFPFLFLLAAGLTLAGCFELVQLVGTRVRLPAWLCFTSVGLLVVAGWPAHVTAGNASPWFWVGSAFAAVVLAAFLVEMATFREPGESVLRIALTVWTAAYLGLLPCFLVQLRWLTDPGPEAGVAAVALAIFVPKCCDIGAYFTGRLLGRHRMTPILSPKKT